jgi:hypothetical protein
MVGTTEQAEESYGVGSCYQAITSDDTQDWKDLVCAMENCKMCELAIVLQLIVVMFHKSIINPITNANPMFSHLTWDNMFIIYNGFQIFLKNFSSFIIDLLNNVSITIVLLL